MRDEAGYVCDSCGEESVLPIDLSAGSEQEYVEDCPVCCRPNVIHVEVDEDGDVRVWAEVGRIRSVRCLGRSPRCPARTPGTGAAGRGAFQPGRREEPGPLTGRSAWTTRIPSRAAGERLALRPARLQALVGCGLVNLLPPRPPGVPGQLLGVRGVQAHPSCLSLTRRPPPRFKLFHRRGPFCSFVDHRRSH